MRTSHFGTILFLLCFLGWNANGEDAPYLRAGIVLNAPLNPSVTAVQVTVSNFIDIGSFNLSLDYDSTIVQYVSFDPHSVFSGMTVTKSQVGGTVKRLTINWPAIGSGITLPDLSTLLNLNFRYLVSGSRSILTWYNSGASCQLTKYAGGSYLVLSDTPTASFYTNGVVTNHPAPVTKAPTITNATSGQVAVPIIISNFYNIGSITLTMQYNPLVLTYQSFTQNDSIPGSFSVGSNTNTTTGITTMNMGWFGEPFDLPDGSTLLTLLFNYSNTGPGNFSELIFSTSPNAACEYSDGQYRLLYDAQPSVFYTNGLVASQLAPQTWLSSFPEATPSASLPVEVKVRNFNSIRSFTLSFKYDPAVATYNNAVHNAAFGGQLNVVNNPVGPDGTRTITMSWTGASSLTLPDLSLIATLDFTYLSGTTSLSWVVNDNTSCRFNDAYGNAFYDKPKSTWYRDGLAASHLAPRTVASYASPAPGQTFTVPILVFGYLDIGLWCLTLDYDPGVLTYQGATSDVASGGTFSANSPGPGRIIMNWSGNSGSLPDSSTLVNLQFTFNGGETPLAFFDNGISCRYAENGSSPALYDQPKKAIYVNGYVGSAPLVANFIANNTLPLENTTVNMTDQSSGNPTSWYWDFSPPTIDFMNGTGPESQTPQVRFTENGAYTVTLIEYRGQAGGIKVKSEYIHAGIPGLWTGITSSEWNMSSNWHNYVVPDAITDVVIPSTAPNWPVFIGNFIMGTHCHHILLQGGGNCRMTIQANP